MEFCFLGDSRLKEHSKEVSLENKEYLVSLVDDLTKIVKLTKGIGLSAIQIGKLDRVFVSNFEGKIVVYINPEFTYKSLEEVIEKVEGCLSIPGVYAKVTRSNNITLKYYDIDGLEHNDTFTGDMARIIQHEMDHLDGILFIDRLSTTRRAVIRSKVDLARKNRQKNIEMFEKISTKLEIATPVINPVESIQTES